jgi:hypothetical protein
MYKFLYQSSTPTVENFAMSNMLTAEPAVQNNEFCLESLLSMESDAFPDSDMMEFVKSPDFFDMDFIMPDWSEQSSPDHSVFSSPGQYPQVVNDVVPDEDVQAVQLLLPASFIDTRLKYVSNHTRY